MNKLFLLYLLCISSSLIFLSAYFSLVFFNYIESVFYIISMIILFSIFFILLLSNKHLFGGTKLLFMSFFFLIMNISLILAKNLFMLNSFALSILGTFEQFSFVSFACLLSIFAYSLNKPINSKIFVLLFSPLIIYSVFLLFLKSQNYQAIDSSINYFILIFTIIYDFLIAYNFYNAYKNSAELGMKSFLILTGLLTILSFSGFKQAGIFFFLNSILLTAGSFILCLGILIEKNLKFYEKIFNKIIESLPKELKGKYISWIIRISLKMPALNLTCKNSKIFIIDNPVISNTDETRLYDELIIFSISWLKSNYKTHNKLIAFIKNYYNSQKILTKKLSQFSL
ncbi:MAG: hypothetical protein PHN56_03495 [Candidatus Nanoarchaeia archaeon]|nr:hypothetical protein [Candidatus Nanoarchaeia archaeon]